MSIQALQLTRPVQGALMSSFRDVQNGFRQCSGFDLGDLEICKQIKTQSTAAVASWSRASTNSFS